jgi:VIT1/CCC1 family predicted Fe2+/Mn2+ transporter
MLNPRTFSFGGTSGILTSIGLIIGLGAATAPKSTIVSGLLIVALADNISDSLSIHMYQEAEKLDEPAALRTTLANFVVRLLFALTFVIIVVVLPGTYATVVALAWGFILLGGLSYFLARVRGVSPLSEVGKHLSVAVVVIGASRVIGLWILQHLQGAAP